MLQNIKIVRYEHPTAHGWAGYLEPEDRTWIAFIGLDGTPRFFLSRDPSSGAILSDDPAEHAGDLADLKSVPGLRTGMVHDGSSGSTSLAIGERVFPLGVYARAERGEGPALSHDEREPDEPQCGDRAA